MVKNFLTSIFRRVENPIRMDSFCKNVENINWKQSDSLSCLNKLFFAIDELATAEVQYYYRRRTTRAWISGATRFLGWIFGTIGILIPLLANTPINTFDNGSTFGYVFLAASGSIFALNSLLGGTDGHIRFVTAQLKIEKIIADAHITWSKFSATSNENNVDYETGFKLISSYAESLYSITISETGDWGAKTQSALKEFAKSLEIAKSESNS